MQVLAAAVRAVLNGFYNVYRRYNTGEDSQYEELASGTLALEQGIYSIIMDVAVYASGIAFMMAAISLYINSRSSSKKHAESKSNLIKVMAISALIWAVVNIVQIVYDAGI